MLLGARNFGGGAAMAVLRHQVSFGLPLSAGVTIYVAASDLIPEVNREPGSEDGACSFYGRGFVFSAGNPFPRSLDLVVRSFYGMLRGISVASDDGDTSRLFPFDPGPSTDRHRARPLRLSVCDRCHPAWCWWDGRQCCTGCGYQPRYRGKFREVRLETRLVKAPARKPGEVLHFVVGLQVIHWTHRNSHAVGCRPAGSLVVSRTVPSNTDGKNRDVVGGLDFFGDLIEVKLAESINARADQNDVFSTFNPSSRSRVS